MYNIQGEDEMKRKICGCLGIFMIFILVIPNIYSYFVKGVFSWHISVVNFWNDLFELLIYTLPIMLLGVWKKNVRSVIICFFAAIYFLSMGTLLQVVIAYLYIEAILLVGRTFNNILFKKKFTIGFQFLMGILIYGVIELILSWLGLGTIDDLRIAAFFLIVICFVLENKNIKSSDLLIVQFKEFIDNLSIKEFLCTYFLIFLIFLGFARVNTHLESDSSWYALYTDKNLFGEKSFFDFLGYTGFIYYYPKFKELLLAPLSGLKYAGYIIAPNIWIFLIMVKESYGYVLKHTKKGDKTKQIILISLLYSTVAIFGMAETAKSDVIGFFLGLMCWIAFSNLIENNETIMFYFYIVSAILMLTVKYTCYLWGAILFIITIIYIIANEKIRKICFSSISIQGMGIVGLSLFVLFSILYRTYHITGFPFGNLAVGIFQKLGLKGRPLFKYKSGINLSSVFEPNRLLKIFFDAGDSGKITAQWTGNYILFFLFVLFSAYIITGRIVKEKGCIWKWIVIVLYAVVSVYFLITMYAPDGNYFGLFIIFITLEMGVLILNNIGVKGIGCIFTWGCVALCFFNIFLNFVVDPSWGCGTRFSYTERNIVATREYNQNFLDNMLIQNGVYKINEYLKLNDRNSFIMMDGANTVLNFMDARIEQSADFSNSYISAVCPENMNEFEEYIDKANVKGFIILNDLSGDSLFEEYVQKYISIHGFIENIQDEKYSYYKIKE